MCAQYSANTRETVESVPAKGVTLEQLFILIVTQRGLAHESWSRQDHRGRTPKVIPIDREDISLQKKAELMRQLFKVPKIMRILTGG